MTRGTPAERIARMQRHVRPVAEGRNPDYSNHNTPKRLAVDRIGGNAQHPVEDADDPIRVALRHLIREEIAVALRERG